MILGDEEFDDVGRGKDGGLFKVFPYMKDHVTIREVMEREEDTEGSLVDFIEDDLGEREKKGESKRRRREGKKKERRKRGRKSIVTRRACCLWSAPTAGGAVTKAGRWSEHATDGISPSARSRPAPLFMSFGCAYRIPPFPGGEVDKL